MDNNVPAAPSTAARPDLDWSQVRETMLMLNLAMAQMEVAMHDSTGSVDVLTHSFTDMFSNMMGLVEAGRSLPDSPQKESIQSLGASVTSQMQGAIVAFQFYDRLSQRLAHVSHSLEDLPASSAIRPVYTIRTPGMNCSRRSVPSTPWKTRS